MKVVCSYCRRKIDEDPAGGQARVSHGFCEECHAHFKKQWEGQSLGEYLDRFDVPVLVVTDTCRILAANQEMADLIGRSEREVHGLLGGEGLECVYARLEEGCGKAVHCRTCAVRNTVLHTLETGESLHRVECYVEGDNGKKPYFISSVKLDRSVQLVFEPPPEKDRQRTSR